MPFSLVRIFVTGLYILLCMELQSQAPSIQWQKCFGGSSSEGIWDLVPASDGGCLMTGSSNSNDGDLSGNNGEGDVWVVKTDATGNIQWQKNLGGSRRDEGYDACQTPDGGYIVTAISNSTDGDVTGNHGGTDIWVIKLNAAGNVQWTKCYGGSAEELYPRIANTSDGGYIFCSQTKSNDGDVSGNHGETDIWLTKIDGGGVIQWQKCFGGTREEIHPTIIQTSDDGYFLTISSQSSLTGDITCATVNQDLWMAKLDNSGNIQWRRCWGGDGPDQSFRSIELPGGGYMVAGRTFSSDIEANQSMSSGFLLKLDATGTIIHHDLFGGSDFDNFMDMELTPDGGVVLVGSTESDDGDVCTVKGINDYWIVKLDAALETEWHRTLGGTLADYATSIKLTPDGGYIAAGHSSSNNGDVSGNNSTANRLDGWLVKLGSPLVVVLPTIEIRASETAICPGKAVTFIATTTLEGTAPVYRWMVNGIDQAISNDTLILTDLRDGDVVSCELKSNSPCVTYRFALSNEITIDVDPSLTPSAFLPGDLVICEYGSEELRPAGTFKTYLWSNNATTPTLKITAPGTYWLEVTSNIDCPGRDTIIVTSKECLKGFFMPTAFSPNGDGKNDILRPFIGGRVLQYKLSIFNRWGQVVFQATDPAEGWNGRLKGLDQNNDVFTWMCSYHLDGEPPKFEKGIVIIIR
jgi:gliding motility-associated-like protein